MLKEPKYKSCECYFVTEVDGEYVCDCQISGICPLEEKEPEEGGEHDKTVC